MLTRETLAEALRNPYDLPFRQRNAEILARWADGLRAKGARYGDVFRAAKRLVPELTGGEFEEAMQLADEADS